MPDVYLHRALSSKDCCWLLLVVVDKIYPEILKALEINSLGHG